MKNKINIRLHIYLHWIVVAVNYTCVFCAAIWFQNIINTQKIGLKIMKNVNNTPVLFTSSTYLRSLFIIYNNKVLKVLLYFEYAVMYASVSLFPYK